MDWIKWKYRQLKQWLIYFVMYRAFWKKLWNSESDNANWEIWHDSDKKTVTLHYVPEVEAKTVGILLQRFVALLSG
jgi:hypothetical protein